MKKVDIRTLGKEMGSSVCFLKQHYDSERVDRFEESDDELV
jgi:hypothetical protein